MSIDIQYFDKLNEINEILRRNDVAFRLIKMPKASTSAQLMLLEILRIQLEDSFADA